MTYALGQGRREGPFPRAGEHLSSTLAHSLTHSLEFVVDVTSTPEL